MSQPPPPPPPRYAWATLLTRPSYLPGALLLAHSLRRVRSAYPLVVLATPSLPASAVAALTQLGVEVQHVAPLRPAMPVSVVAERFADTWDKLRAFGMEGYEVPTLPSLLDAFADLTKPQRVVLIDGDMLVLQNMDDLFTLPLPGTDWIAANHACVCNWGRDAWAPSDWRPWTCPYTPVAGPHAPATQITPRSPPTYTLLNSGLVVLHPSPAALAGITSYLSSSPLVPTFAFPDQDLLGAYFKDRWLPLPWDVNAIKTARYWHPNLWADAAVRNLHYIVDKPWAAAPARCPVPEDRTTHGWWWAQFYEWRREARARGCEDAVRECERWMLGRKGEDSGGEIDVGDVESWEESVREEAQGRPKGYAWPPGERWGVEVDGVQW
jgi:inositol 3-alpha-galactosyltransferase